MTLWGAILIASGDLGTEGRDLSQVAHQALLKSLRLESESMGEKLNETWKLLLQKFYLCIRGQFPALFLGTTSRLSSKCISLHLGEPQIINQGRNKDNEK